MKARYLYSELASAIQARKNCADAMARLNPNAVSATTDMKDNEYHQRAEWFDKWTATIESLVREHCPSGSGFDAGTAIDLDASHANRLVFRTSFHHMDEAGFYTNWTAHTVTVTPSLTSHYHIRISGRNQNDVKDYIHESFDMAMCTEIDLIRADPC
jgi:hypothetical protein